MKTRMTTKKKVIFSLIAVLLVVLVVWTAWGNTALQLNKYVISSEKLPEEFSGYRIAHVSDFHNAEIGKDNETLLTMLEETEPDIIAITGDIIDSYHTDTEIALQFVREAVKIAPCYYVTGNHEARILDSEYFAFEEMLVKAGVTVMHDSEVILKRDGASISLTGIDDPAFAANYGGGVGLSMMSGGIRGLSATDGFYIVLSHRPEFFEQYVEADMDLVLCGHAHGGQFRLPFVGGLIAPNQGLFPKYDAGLYTENNTNMIVSRGIGNSIFPFRFNNRPEVILIELQAVTQ